ncbi:MAG: DUF5916 domain-containing protein [Bacteroidales bacterium]
MTTIWANTLAVAPATRPFINDERKSVSALRITTPPVIDGILDESVWEKAVPVSGFIQYEPHNDRLASHETFVRVLYDNRSIYISAVMNDPQPENILTELGLRNSGRNLNADRFWIDINPFDDGINGFTFEISASGVQTDINLSGSGGGRGDSGWDAVWKSAVKITDKGWTAEIEIPYSALRFPKSSIQQWGINFWRETRRTRETSSWNFVDRRIGDPLRFMGKLTEIDEITPPLRLGLYPYMTGYLERNSIINEWGNTSSIGMDIKYGLSQNFTLDMTLIPDFTQVQSDAKILSLSPHEVKYDEQRQFFKEGIELFERADLFYSRRIGSMPSGYHGLSARIENDEIVMENPMETRLINASKVSGRTSSGFGLGLFNAMTSASMARVMNINSEDSRYIATQPFTNYNLLVADQTLKNNSFISLINSNVAGSKDGYTANVTGTEFRFFNRSNIFSLRGSGAVSQQYYSGRQNNFGYKYMISAGKFGGTWQYNYTRTAITDSYEQNDMGYLRHNNLSENGITASHNLFDPFWRVLTLTNGLNIKYSELFEPSEFTGLTLGYNLRVLFDTRFFTIIRANYHPLGKRDFFEPRVPGRFYETGREYDLFMMYSSDYRKNIYVDGNFSYAKVTEGNIQEEYGFEVMPTFRASDQVRISYGINYQEKNNDAGYVFHTSPDSVYFGKRPSSTLTNSLRSTCIFNSDISLSFDLRHYWSRVNYTGDYYLLNAKGKLDPASPGRAVPDINYNAFTIDMMFAWHFAPGSKLTLVWKNMIDNRKGELSHNYFNNLKDVLGHPQINSLSLRVLYYIDYQSLRPGITGRS